MSVTTREEENGSQKATAKVKASESLQATLRNEARAAAREAAREELSAQTGGAAHLMQLFRAAYENGGSARVAALVERCAVRLTRP